MSKNCRESVAFMHINPCPEFINKTEMVSGNPKAKNQDASMPPSLRVGRWGLCVARSTSTRHGGWPPRASLSVRSCTGAFAGAGAGAAAFLKAANGSFCEGKRCQLVWHFDCFVSKGFWERLVLWNQQVPKAEKVVFWNL